MSIKKTIIMLLIAAVAVGAFMFDKKKEEKQIAVKEAEMRLVAPKKEEITEVTVRQGADTTQTTQLVKKGEDWEITQPIKTAADKASVDTLLNELDGARRIDAFEPEAGRKLDEFGLDKPELKVEIKAAGANYVQELELGGKTTAGNEVYARAAKDPKIFTVNESVVTQLTRPVKDLRYKNALPAALDNPTSAVLTFEGKTIELTKKGGDWALLSPVKEPADTDKVGEILGNIGRVTAVDFIDTAPLNMAQMGLDKPALTGLFTATVKDRAQTMTLLVGNEVTSKEGEYYAMNKGANYAFTLTRDDLDKLKPSLDDLRSKKLFNTTMADAARVIIDMRGQKVDLTADSAGKWTYTGEPDARLDQSAVNQTVGDLVNLKATRFIDEQTTPGQTGLESPFLRLTVVNKNGKTTETVATGHTAPDDAFVYALVENNHRMVGLDSGATKKFFVNRDQFVDKTLFASGSGAFDETLVKKIQIKEEGKTVELTAQDSGSWAAKAEGQAKEFQVEGPKVSALIFSISSLNWARRYTIGVPVDETVIKENKLEQPTREIILLDKDGKELARLGQGPDKDDMTLVRKGLKEFYGINKVNYNSVSSSLESVLAATKAQQ